MSALRPQDRAERINAECEQRAEALVKQYQPQVGLSEREQQLDTQRALANTRASLLRAWVHALCRELHNLERFIGAASEGNTYTCTVELYSRPVLLQYHVEDDEKRDGTPVTDVFLDYVNGLSADALDQGMQDQWQKACEQDFRERCKTAREEAAIDRAEVAHV